MAEINIQKKKKPVWPWILLVVILLLLGWAVYELVLRDGQAQALAAVCTQMSASTLDFIPDVIRT